MDKDLHIISDAKYFNNSFTVGDVEKWDFITYLALDGNVTLFIHSKVLAVAGSPHKRMMIMKEAFRLEIVPIMKEIVYNKCTPEKIELLIRVGYLLSFAARKKVRLLQKTHL